MHKITEVSLYVFHYRLFHEDFSQARMLYAFEIYFAKKVHRVKNDPHCADMCAFLSMLIKV